MISRTLAVAGLLAIAAPHAVSACSDCWGGDAFIEGTKPPIQPLFAPRPAEFDDVALRAEWLAMLPMRLHAGTGGLALPEGARIDDIHVLQGHVAVRLAAPSAWLREFGEEQLQSIAVATAQMVREIGPTRMVSYHARELGGSTYKTVAEYVPPGTMGTPPPSIQRAKPDEQSTQPVRGEAQPVGALTGASVFLSPGHGWYYNEKAWVTQRSPTNGIIEDHSNAEAVMQNLAVYLWNAGARVYTVRERDFQTNMVVVNAEDAAMEGDWIAETATGARDGKQFVARTTKKSPTATAAFTPAIPEDGFYAVYVWYRPATKGGTSRDTTFTIRHTGGSTRWVQDQNHDGYTWKYTGTYYFEKGTNPTKGSVFVANQSSRSGDGVVIDAVRFGGGMGDVVRGGSASGKPRWEEAGEPYTEFMGFDSKSSTRRYNQVHAMPRLAEWEMEEWEKGKAIYVAWHTNASAEHDASGISSYIYGENAWGPPSDFSGYPGGAELAKWVHGEVLRDVRAAWDPEWQDIGIVSRWLGETNPNSNAKMPSVLVENGFHDNPRDAAYILDPRFRRLSARATYQGIVKYYAHEVPGFDNATLLPEPPTHLQVSRSGHDVTLRWNPPPFDSGDGVLGNAASSYRVYRSLNGKGFDNGTPVEGTQFTLAGIPPRDPLFFRVAAVNSGGESFPSETLGASLPAQGSRTPVLVVNGFDRLDREMNVKEGPDVERGILARMNSRDYIVAHARALEAAGVAFDSCGNEAVINGAMPLASYKAVVWILGKESGSDPAFEESEQRIVQDYLAAGGSLFVSGSDAAMDLVENERGPAFLGSTLRASFVRNSADTHLVRGVAGSIFEGIAELRFDDGTAGVYAVDSPDVLAPANGGASALTYAGGNETAAIVHDGGGRLVYLAFPFETIVGAESRADVMKRSMAFLLRDAP